MNIPLDTLNITQLAILSSAVTWLPGCQRQTREGTCRALGLEVCSREGPTAAGRPAVLGTKDGGAEPQLWDMSDSWAEDRNRSVRTASVAS